MKVINLPVEQPFAKKKLTSKPTICFLLSFKNIKAQLCIWSWHLIKNHFSSHDCSHITWLNWCIFHWIQHNFWMGQSWMNDKIHESGCMQWALYTCSSQWMKSGGVGGLLYRCSSPTLRWRFSTRKSMGLLCTEDFYRILHDVGHTSLGNWCDCSHRRKM